MAPVLVLLRPSSEALLRARAPGARDQYGCRSHSLHRARSASKKDAWLLSLPIFPSLFSPSQDGLFGLPLRATFSPAQPTTGTPRLALSPSEGPPILYTYVREWPRLPFTARIERPPLHRGGSASKKGTWPLPSPPLTALSSGSYNSRYGLGRNALIQVARIIHECRREAFETEARRGFSQVRPT
jgi:hypothetical protein